ncbi:MAG: hypothetical protein HOP28_13170 [Gemmatimonadales bacterium]|nr:hypothetical protein [Gemmatimonadales bacterium]
MTEKRGCSPEDLLAAIAFEGRVLGDLCDLLAKQRAGVAADDAGAVEAATHAVSRVLFTLSEARRRRVALVEALTGVVDGRLALVESILGSNPVLKSARRELQARAERVIRDLAVTQTVLRRAVLSGEAYLRSMLAATAGPSTAYGPAGAPPDVVGSGILFNRTG